MRSSHSAPSPRRKRRLNLTAIKSVVVVAAGMVAAFGSAISGIGAQVAFGPMLGWMLGFAPQKAQASAMRYAVFASAAAAAGAYVSWLRYSGARAHFALDAGSYLLAGLLLFITATAGAALAAPAARNPALLRSQRLFQAIGVGIGVAVMLETARHGMWNPIVRSPGPLWWLAPLGFAVGACSQAMGLATGVLLVPALVYLQGYFGVQAIAVSLLVVFLAGILPSVSYGAKGLIDPTYTTPAIAGGMVGGYLGGMLLPFLSERAALLCFAILAMFLSARELARISLQPKEPPRLEL